MDYLKESLNEYPPLIQRLRNRKQSLNSELKEMRSRRSDRKVEFKMAAREADEPSNRTERKAYAKRLRQSNDDFQNLLEEIQNLEEKREQVAADLERARKEFEVRLQMRREASAGNGTWTIPKSMT